QQNDSFKPLDGPARAAATTNLTLHLDDFPVQFVVLDADAGILRLANIAGSLRYQDGAVAVTQPFQLSAANPAATLPLPPTATGPRLDGAGAPLAIGPLPAASQHFSLASFPQYGPQLVDLQCRFAGAAGALTVELLAEGRDETPANVASYYFTPAQTTAQFQY